jgi:arginyl-tRNA synthetase
VNLIPQEIPNVNYSLLWAPPWWDLVRLTIRYPDVIKSPFHTVDPTPILSYLFQIVEEINSCLDEAEEDESRGEGYTASSKYTARTVLYDSVKQILESGMKLLGVTAFGS